MQAILDHLELQLVRHVPDLARRLRAPATTAQIEQVESLLGRPLPADLRAAYLWHDGTLAVRPDPSDMGPELFGPFSRWCSLEMAMELWHRDLDHWQSDVDGSFEDYVNDPDNDNGGELRYWPAVPSVWLCIGYSGTRSRTFVDLYPGSSGICGQLVDSDGEGSERVLAPGIREYFSWLASSLEQRTLTYDASTQRWQASPRTGYFRWV